MYIYIYIYIYIRVFHRRATNSLPNLPANTVPTNIASLKLSGKSPMDMRIPPL